jgi:hypothetical protein
MADSRMLDDVIAVDGGVVYANAGLEIAGWGFVGDAYRSSYPAKAGDGFTFEVQRLI